MGGGAGGAGEGGGGGDGWRMIGGWGGRGAGGQGRKMSELWGKRQHRVLKAELENPCGGSVTCRVGGGIAPRFDIIVETQTVCSIVCRNSVERVCVMYLLAREGEGIGFYFLLV